MEPYEHIKTLKDACNTSGLDYEAMRSLSDIDQLKVIILALNGDFDCLDDRHTHYYPYFSFLRGDWTYEGYTINKMYGNIRWPEMALKSPELAKYAGSTFLSYYSKILQ